MVDLWAGGRGRAWPHHLQLLLLLLLLLALAMAPNVLVGRDVMIPASTWDTEPPQLEGWPGKVTEYNTGGSSSRGGRGRRWGVMAGVDIADSRHTGAGSRTFNQSATVILTLEELKKWIVLKQGESVEEITGDAFSGVADLLAD